MSPKINSVLPAGPIECSANANDQYFTKLTFRIQFVRELFIVDHFLVISQLQTTNLKKLPPSSPGPRRAAKGREDPDHLKMTSTKLLCLKQCHCQKLVVSFLLNSLFMDEKRFC